MNIPLKMSAATTHMNSTPASRPNKRFRLLLWFYLYKIPCTADLRWFHDIQASCHCKLPLDIIQASRSEFPQEWAKMLEKRERRRAFHAENGYIWDGWTPPVLDARR